MNTRDVAPVLATLMRELVHGAPDTSTQTYMLNRGDAGLLASLERLSAAQASATPGGGTSIAAHVDHLRYGIILVNRVAAGTPVPRDAVDWTTSWKRTHVTDAEWRALRDALRNEAEAWIAVLATPRELGDFEAAWTLGTLPHLAYHFGAIRQMDRAARGPTAEDEREAEKALRKA